MKSNLAYRYWNLISNITRYNLKIIFANRFIWFFAASIVVYAGLSMLYVLQVNVSKMEDLYMIYLLSGILLIFYPTIFGIQNDQDAKTIEILFGIPNYRYKVYLVRLILVYTATFVILLLFSTLSSYMITRFRVFEMTSQVMFPVMFFGTMAFFFSTVIKSGYGTVVVVLIIGVLMLTLSAGLLSTSLFNPFLNPFEPAGNVSETAWRIVVRDSRIFLATGTVLFLLLALLLLSKREKYM